MKKQLSDFCSDLIPICEDECEATLDKEECKNDEVPGCIPIISFENEHNINQWSEIDGSIISVSNTYKTLDAGYYSINSSQNLGLFFRKEKIETNKLYRFPNKITNIIMDDVDKFWESEEVYRKYNRVFRRNYLLYSAPGTGKTSLINLMCQDLIEKYNGIIFSLSCESDLMLFPDAIRRVKKLEPDRKIITIIEDIDAFTQSSRSLNSLLLNILDGNIKFGGMVIIATTNHIELLEERYVNRPSRFDKVVEFPLPNEDSRRMFIEKTVLPEDLSKIDINKWVEKSNGYTIDHLNELILLFFVFGHSEEESFELMNTMVKKNNSLKNTKSVNKKSIGFDND